MVLAPPLRYTEGMNTTRPAPLTGLKVLDLSRVLAGPFCSMSLGDMGAEVIKIERPDGGDDTRRFGPPFLGEESTYYLSVNRNKRSVALDLKHPDGKAALWKLIDWADVLLENFRPGTMARLGFDESSCRTRNPRLIYCSISAYGHAGLPEWTAKPGYDVILQGVGGIPSLTGPRDGAPHKVGASIADVVSGMNAVQGILLALIARDRDGVGQHVDCSMLDGQIGLLTYLASATLNTGSPPPRLGNGHLSVSPYSSFEAQDGWLNIAVANEKLWGKFITLLELPGLGEDPRFTSNPKRVQNNDALEAVLRPKIKSQTVADWILALEGAGIPAGPVLRLDQSLAHPQLAARDMVIDLPHPTLGSVRLTGVPVRLAETPGTPHRHPPRLGEHTREVLLELGLDTAAIEQMLADGVAAQLV